jgi:hypothetical protein
MVEKNTTPLQGGIIGNPQQRGTSLSSNIYMCDWMTNLQT